jgi:hypothetical protein
MFENLLKFILGFVLALAVLSGTGLIVAFYFVNRTAVNPPKPIFANDNSTSQTKKPQAISQTEPKEKIISISSPIPAPSPIKSPNLLPPGAYQGIVTWAGGLSMRSEPDINSPSTSGVGTNKKVIILEESTDKKWQKIRIADTNQEGWVKAGNIQRSQ